MLGPLKREPRLGFLIAPCSGASPLLGHSSPRGEVSAVNRNLAEGLIPEPGLRLVLKAKLVKYLVLFLTNFATIKL